MIKFGPAGNSESFYAEGHKHTYEAMEWVAARGLNAYEYSFGRGVRIGEATASKLRDEALKHGVQLSVHAPYFINLACEDDKIENNIRYFLESAAAARMMGARRIVFHPGSRAKADRSEMFALAKKRFRIMLDAIDANGYGDLTFCPETMGKISQLGDLNEVIELCQMDERVLPTIDFGHLHTRGIGALNTREDFAYVLDALINGIGIERTRVMHSHFSKIEYTKAGEKRHVRFEDEGFGPDFALLAPEIAKRGLEPTFICESNGTMAEDAMAMKAMYEAVIKA